MIIHTNIHGGFSKMLSGHKHSEQFISFLICTLWRALSCLASIVIFNPHSILWVDVISTSQTRSSKVREKGSNFSKATEHTYARAGTGTKSIQVKRYKDLSPFALTTSPSPWKRKRYHPVRESKGFTQSSYSSSPERILTANTFPKKLPWQGKPNPTVPSSWSIAAPTVHSEIRLTLKLYSFKAS